MDLLDPLAAGDPMAALPKECGIVGPGVEMRSNAPGSRSGIARRLGLTFALLFGIFAIAGGFAVAGLLEMHAALHEVETDAGRMRNVLRLASAVRDQYAHLAHTIIIGNDSHAGLYDEASDAVTNIARLVDTLASGEAERGLVRSLTNRSRQLDALFHESLLPAVQRGDSLTTGRLHDRVLHLVAQAQQDADELSAIAARSIAAFGSHASAIEHVTIRWMLVLLLGSMIAAVGLGIHVYRSIARPVARLAAGATRIAGGDLDTSIEISSRDELGRLAEQFNAMTVSLKEHQNRLVRTEKLAGIGRLAAGVAHEINNPLGVVLGYVKLLLRKADGELAHDLRIVEQEADRCRQVVEDLLDLTRISPTRTEAVDLRTLTDEIVGRLDATLPRPHARIETVGSAVVLANATRIRQVLHNLLKNACEVTDPSDHVDVRIAQNQEQAVLEVVDRGPGVAAEHRDRLFEPFFTTKASGSGLGLAVSRGIARSYGGDLVFDNLPAGAVFRLTLPLAGPAR
jgi:two-component system, NtrC family, sensor kinase